jgi:hypothetical protein
MKPRIVRDERVIGGWRCFDKTHWGCGTTPHAAYVDYCIDASGIRS